MDNNVEQPNQIARSFAFFFYAFCVFVGIRVWIEVVASGDRSAIIAAAVITFLVILCIFSRYRRHRRLMEMRNRRRVGGGLDMFELFARHRGLLEAEGINVHGGLTQAAIDKLPNVVFKEGGLQMMPPPPTEGESDVTKLEEGTLGTPPSSSSAGNNVPYKTVATVIPDDLMDKEVARIIVDRHNDINSCPICLNDFILDEVLLFLPKCGHAYHRACITEWLVNHNSCPLCKHEVITLPALPGNDHPLIVNVDNNNTNNTNTVINNVNRPVVLVDDGGIAILRLPNNQGVGIYFIDNNNTAFRGGSSSSSSSNGVTSLSPASEHQPAEVTVHGNLVTSLAGDSEEV